MVRLHKSSQRLELTAPAYTLSFDRERPWVVGLATGTGERIADLFVGSSVDTVRGRDELEPCGPPLLAREQDATVVTFQARSSQWAAKRYVFVCHEGEVEYRVEVEGRGAVDTCHLLQGCLPEDALRLGLGPSRFREPYQRPYGDLARGTRPRFTGLFSPRPTAAERDLRLPYEDDVIDLVDDPQRHGGCDAFLPALWATAFELEAGEPWVVAGLAPRLDQLDFSSFGYRGGATCGFDVAYDGRLRVDGSWSSPALLFCFGARDVYGAFRHLVNALARRDLLRLPTEPSASWWQRPVFDGAGQQRWLARGGPLAAEGTLANYLDALALLDRAGVDPGVLWIGPGWGRDDEPWEPDALRWPDLAGFIARQQEQGRRVVLDWPLWGGDDLSGAVERTLSSSGLHADGLRLVDLAGPDGSVGALRQRLGAVRGAARSQRPDALLIAPVGNPYYADLVDMVPLGSLWTDRLLLEPLLRHRATMARVACPSWLLAVTDAGVPSLDAWREVVELQPTLGVPVLSQVGGLPAAGESLTTADLELVAATWRGLGRGGGR